MNDIFSKIQVLKKQRNAVILAHYYQDPDIQDVADFIGSTTAIINYANGSDKREFIIATEPGVIHQMQKQNPPKRFIPLPSNDGCACNECPHMRLNTLEKMVNALETLSPQIHMSEEKRLAALKPLERMLELS
tara:strand:- start:946 stop:1344 length:399 start_codon:yes stop_codon:yes gene_type:complete